ncbi:hypothetical protein GCM10009738_57860 [Kitasatospora viridis]
MGTRIGSRGSLRTPSSHPDFHAACGPGNLTEALTLFRTWATAHTP